MFVVSFIIALAMPKSISLSEPLTSIKLAGFKSECTIRSSCIVLTASSICYSRKEKTMRIFGIHVNARRSNVSASKACKCFASFQIFCPVNCRGIQK
jgi:hypothetical protein